MKIDKITPCICVEHIPEAGDSSFYGMPQLQVTQIWHGHQYYTPFCPNCGRGGLSQYKSAYLAFKGWNEMQERLWRMNDGKPMPYVKKDIDTLPRNGYDNWARAHADLGIAPGEHFWYAGSECRVRSDGNEILFYDTYDNTWSCPPGDCTRCQLNTVIAHKQEIKKLPFARWHVEAGEPDHIWHRYVHERLDAEPVKKHRFRICYIDGFDLKYKTVEVDAESKEKALETLWNHHSPEGDFDHQIREITEFMEDES